MTRPTDAHVRAMPKVELHVHIEGAAPASTVADLARRHGIDLGVDDPADLYHYADLADFLRVFDLVCRCLRTADDIHRVTYEAMAIAAAAGVRVPGGDVLADVRDAPRRVVRHDLDGARRWSAGRRDRPWHRGPRDHRRPQTGRRVRRRRARRAGRGVRPGRAGRHRRRRRRGGRRPGVVRAPLRRRPPAGPAHDDAPRRGGAGGRRRHRARCRRRRAHRPRRQRGAGSGPAGPGRGRAHPAHGVPDLQRRHRHRRLRRRPSASRRCSPPAPTSPSTRTTRRCSGSTPPTS